MAHSHNIHQELLYNSRKHVSSSKIESGRYRIQLQVGVMTGKPGEKMKFRPASFFAKDKATASKFVDLLKRSHKIFLTYEEVEVEDSTFLNVLKWTALGIEQPKKKKGKKKSKK